jgi:hypothetical protein
MGGILQQAIETDIVLGTKVCCRRRHMGAGPINKQNYRAVYFLSVKYVSKCSKKK